MNNAKEYAALFVIIEKNKRRESHHETAEYLGTTHILYNVSVPNLRSIAKTWVSDHKAILFEEYISFIDILYRAPSREEKIMASMILGFYPKFLTICSAKNLDEWLGQLAGWEEVDGMCGQIDVWLRTDVENRIALLQQWNIDSQIEKRRASLVVLCSTTRHGVDKHLAHLSFQFIDALKNERHGMITKAISWLLRSLIKYHKDDVAAYIAENKTTLPSIAVREAANKLKTGKKT